MSNVPPESSAIDATPDSASKAVTTFWKKAFGPVVSLIALAIIGFSVEWSKVGDAVLTMHYWPLIPAVGLIALQMILRGMRWRYLLPRDETVTLRMLVDAIMVGNLASSLLPLRAGEFIRPLLLSLQTRYSFPTGFVSVVIERFFDLSAVLIAFGIVALTIDGIPPWVAQGASALSVLAFGLLSFIVMASLCQEFVRKMSFYFLAFLPLRIRTPLEKFVLNLLEGAVALRDVGNLAKVIALSVAVWIATFASYQAYFWLFDIPGSFMQAVVVTVFIALAVAAPSAPGFIGVYQIGCVAAFSLFFKEIEVATAYALISHLIQYVTTLLYGGYALSRTEWSLADLMRRRDR